jgi:glyoxylase-like metal-dependent hydrolase (beta-lactamase superfamily II)
MRTALLICTAAFAAFPLSDPASAQQTRPQIETRKVEGTDGVYIFRNGNHQSIFIVTKDGVIATDPIAYGRPTGGADYVAEIRKVTDKKIKYLVYSHHHYDHVAGGQAFKDAGAKIVAHKRAKERLAQLKDPHTPLPDEVFDKSRTISLGGTKLELTYVGLNHSDSTLVMRLPKEKILFVVDLVPVGSFPGRGMIDFYPLEAMDSLKRIEAMEFDRLIPGHPGAPNDRLGTKQDVADQLTLQQHVSDRVRAAAQEGKCWEPVEKEMQFDKYKDLPGYANGLPMVLRRYCALWGRGT